MQSRQDWSLAHLRDATGSFSENLSFSGRSCARKYIAATANEARASLRFVTPRGSLQLHLAFVRRAFEEKYGDKPNRTTSIAREQVSRAGRNVWNEKRESAVKRRQTIKSHNRAAMPEPQIRQPVRRVVLPGEVNGSKPRRAREIETSDVSKMGTPKIRTGTSQLTGKWAPSGRILRPECGHQEPRNIAPPSPMKIFAGLKFQRKNPRAAPRRPRPVRTMSGRS